MHEAIRKLSEAISQKRAAVLATVIEVTELLQPRLGLRSRYSRMGRPLELWAGGSWKPLSSRMPRPP